MTARHICVLVWVAFICLANTAPGYSVGEDASSDFMDIAIGVHDKAKRVTDKVVTHSYETMYGFFLEPLRRVRGLRMLEIGLGCDMKYGPGASVELWRRYLPFIELWEADINQECVMKSQKSGKLLSVQTLVGDQSDPSVLATWINTAVRPGPSGGFDVIIDDGSHINSHILGTFQTLWTAALNPGGLYFIEDLQVGRLKKFDDSHASAVMADVLSSWVEQLALGKFRERKVAAVNLTRRFILPKFVKGIFCQDEACVVISCSARERVVHCIHGKRCCERLENSRFV